MSGSGQRLGTTRETSGGQTRRVLIGRHTVISAAAARQTALGFALDWSRGAGKKTLLRVPTLSEAMESYLARAKLCSEEHRHGLLQQFKLHLKEWMGLPLDEITKSMVVQKHLSMAATPSAANHTLKSFRTVWSHARRVHDLPEAPTLAIEWFEVAPKRTIINDLQKWRRSVDSLSNPIHRAFYEILLFTGFRKTDALTLEWQHVHEDRIHLPLTKNGRSSDLPILQHHHEILAPLRGLHRQCVFPSPKSAHGHLVSAQRIAWSPHAHGRTFATVTIDAGVLEEIVGRLLNHTPLSIAGQRYVRPSNEALSPAMETICHELLRRT